MYLLLQFMQPDAAYSRQFRFNGANENYFSCVNTHGGPPNNLLINIKIFLFRSTTHICIFIQYSDAFQ